MDGYSRLVALLKVVLPLLALALLSTLFLLSQRSSEEVAIPYSEAEIADRLREQQVTGPFFTATTADGDRIAVTADTMSVILGGNRAQGIEARMDLVEGGWITLDADMGEVNIAAAHAELQGNVDFTTDRDLNMVSDLMTANLETGSLLSPGPVIGTSPWGRLNAGQMALQTSRNDGPAQLIFTNGVKLVYTPKLSETGGDP
ncbi:MAG: hypothetical protein AAF218_11150 [Pseudomonadota bacterium]